MKSRVLVCGVEALPKIFKLNPLFETRLIRDFGDLRAQLQFSSQVAFVVVYADRLTEKQVIGLVKLAEKMSNIHFILVGQIIENTAKQHFNMHQNVHFFWRREEGRLEALLIKIKERGPVFSRRSERVAISAPALLKASQYLPWSPIGQKMKLLEEGKIVDFSKHGASVLVSEGSLKPKDFVCIMYKKSCGKWIAVESQIRWMRKDPASGSYLFGLQFIATA